jgi:hypothetical protein
MAFCQHLQVDELLFKLIKITETIRFENSRIMKNSIMIAFVMLSIVTSSAQIKNAKTEQVKIYGNCGMCEKTIEKAGNLKNMANVDWDKDTKMATITYNSVKSTKDEILKRIALAGYDNDSFLAPDDVYSNLHGCCQYDREAKTAVKTEAKLEIKSEMNMEENHDGHIHTEMKEEKKDAMKAKMESKHAKMTSSETKKENQLDAVYENYFAVKDALVKTDSKAASVKAKELLASLNAVKMGELKMDVHMVWMKVMKNLKEDSTIISASTDVKKQRDSFDTLSENIYQLIKISKAETPVYFQHCPMANDGKGANWLSKEEKIKNPYYDSMMMSCGKVVETIK